MATSVELAWRLGAAWREHGWGQGHPTRLHVRNINIGAIPCRLQYPSQRLQLLECLQRLFRKGPPRVPCPSLVPGKIRICTGGGTVFIVLNLNMGAIQSFYCIEYVPES